MSIHQRAFLLLSGEHPTLPYAEVRSLLRSEGISYPEEVKDDQVLVLPWESRLAELLGARAALVMEGGRLLACADHSQEALRRACGSIDWGFLEGKRFGVRVTRIKRYWTDADLQLLERRIGDSIPTCLGAKVDLKSPEVWVRGVISARGIYLFMSEFKTERGTFFRRRPKTRPYFHPGVLEPKLSRTFVNLSSVRGGELFVDPFCGTGGFIIEAAMMGIKSVGIDLDLRMVRGALMNARFYGLDCDILHGDATELPLARADGIATDPPYGRGSSTKGERVEDLLRGLMRGAREILRKGGRVCFAAPSEVRPSLVAEREGLQVLEEHMMRVHKSLTRAIVIAESG
ncbi:MAG: hypothetical protein QFX35_05930 [Candidatus Verstraetearchaeota archaeon]|nr:hypothetical protein [Candidatus Verstraetearchaeota archaeon]